MISVIIPCLDAEDYLGVAIRSLLNQSRQPDEIIVADNGSSDGSRNIAQSFGQTVRLIDVPEKGAPAARTAGYERCSGDAIMFMDADDLLAPDALHALEEALAGGGGNVGCCPWYRYEYEGEAWIVAPASCPPRRPGQDDLAAWLTGWYHPPCSVLWSRTAFERSGGWDPEIGMNQDGDVMMRGFVAGNRLVRTSEGAAFYRRLPDGKVSLSARRASERGIRSRIQVIDRIAHRIQFRGAVRRYAASLEEAYAAIAHDCGAHASREARRCQKRIQKYRDARSPLSAPLRHGGVQFSLASDRFGKKISLARGGREVSTIAERPDRQEAPVIGDPLVTVIVPTFNRVSTLLPSVESVLSQTYRNFELLVVDDGSTDGTPSLIREIEDSRVRLVQLPQNRGPSAARNRGIAEARGSLIAFLDSDDLWFEDKLAGQVDLFRQSSARVGMAITGVETVYRDGERRVDVPEIGSSVFTQLLMRNVLHGGGSSAMIRREVFDTVGGFDTRLPAAEDYDLWIRIARFFEIDCVPRPLIRYHDAADTTGEAGSLRVSRNYAKNRKARAMLFERYAADMQRAGFDHLYLLNSAERELEQTGGSMRNASLLAAKALARRPLAPYTYRWLLTRLAPLAIRRLASG
ncbi:glycosyltransferase family 2 protein [Qipengyuania spongiae]|uniref:Glycosyltransferase family 2 protein n=1 Tax=Qipengyuania spongiae TaxID=2909673 RepID=A0ABY5SZE8_9SPHN|nr:glycosyltransferase family 2 protein [Qipengyuania spongiae]UVI39560.1 glycosyltransferase family 2 protein [Qipengyuania spongiae]